MPEAPAARRLDRSVVPRPGMTSPGGGSTGLDRGGDVDGDAEVREAPREHGVLRCALGPEWDAELEELVPAGGDPYRRVEVVLAGRKVRQGLDELGGDARRHPVRVHAADGLGGLRRARGRL